MSLPAISVDHSFTSSEGVGSPLLGIHTGIVAASNARADRFWLQAIARMILPEGFRTKVCYLVPRGRSVEVRLSAKGSATFGQLCLCGSPWTCPVCAYSIALRRRAELVQALKNWRGGGGHVAMLTKTIRHRAADPLLSSIKGLVAARRSLSRHRQFNHIFRVSCGCVHNITATEVTHGANGWHPHDHQLLLTREKITAIPDGLHRAWANSCEAAGLRRPDDLHGLVLTHDADEYVTKWGFAEELAGHSLKSSITPFRLLAQLSDTGDNANARLFVEYAKATKGMHQLQWSRGAKAALGINQVDDIEASEPNHMEKAYIVLCYLSLADWALIRKGDKREELCRVAESEGEEGVRRFIAELSRSNPHRKIVCF